MKKILSISLVLFLVLASISTAEARRRGNNGGMKFLNRCLNQINLTDEQQQKISEIQKDYAIKNIELKAKADIKKVELKSQEDKEDIDLKTIDNLIDDMMVLKAEIMKNNDHLLVDIKKQLTDEQIQELKELKKEMREKMKGRWKGRWHEKQKERREK